VYVVDAMTNNPGAAGGALVNRRGELLGLLGKELRSAQTSIWLNYAIPAEELARPVADLAAGRGSAKPAAETRKPAEAHDLARLGVVLVPDVVARTPPFVDFVRPGTPAEAAGVKPDDLILLVGDELVSSCHALREQVGRIELIEVSLKAPRAESK
jgi:serine protease Do